MFISQAFAQSTGAPGAGDFIGMVLPLVLIMGVFYFLLIRPQQRKMKEHQAMLSKVAKGDTVVTQGGLIGKVVRVVDDSELLVEVGENVKVRVLKSGLADVRSKGEPAK
jgi:preprotein translocase subunit YajC